MKPSSMEQALDDRRLFLIMDQQGIVTKVNTGCPPTLFGFDPSDMVGKPISSYVDVFQKEDAVDEADSARYFQDLLVDLAIR